MTSDVAAETAVDEHDLAALCARHLGEEEALLTAALPILRAARDSFTHRNFQDLTKALVRHQEFARLAGAMNHGRRRFSAQLAARLRIDPSRVTLELALSQLPDSAQPALAGRIEQVRKLADELCALNYWVAVHLRIHLEAYRRILRDLTHSSTGSGRYGPAGKAESLDYGPMFHCRG
jgi:hypothetical protein